MGPSTPSPLPIVTYPSFIDSAHCVRYETLNRCRDLYSKYLLFFMAATFGRGQYAIVGERVMQRRMNMSQKELFRSTTIETSYRTTSLTTKLYDASTKRSLFYTASDALDVRVASAFYLHNRISYEDIHVLDNALALLNPITRVHWILYGGFAALLLLMGQLFSRQIRRTPVLIPAVIKHGTLAFVILAHQFLINFTAMLNDLSVAKVYENNLLARSIYQKPQKWFRTYDQLYDLLQSDPEIRVFGRDLFKQIVQSEFDSKYGPLVKGLRPFLCRKIFSQNALKNCWETDKMRLTTLADLLRNPAHRSLFIDYLSPTNRNQLIGLDLSCIGYIPDIAGLVRPPMKYLALKMSRNTRYKEAANRALFPVRAFVAAEVRRGQTPQGSCGARGPIRTNGEGLDLNVALGCLFFLGLGHSVAAVIFVLNLLKKNVVWTRNQRRKSSVIWAMVHLYMMTSVLIICPLKLGLRYR